MKDENPFLYIQFTRLSGDSPPSYSQVDRKQNLIRSALHGLEYEIKAGFSIGTAPSSLPAFRNRLTDTTQRWLSASGRSNQMVCRSKQARVIVGLRLENKSHDNGSHRQKNYNMEILGQGGERISGVWTGGKQSPHFGRLTIPLMATYKVSNRWNIKKPDLIFSYLLSKREFFRSRIWRIPGKMIPQVLKVRIYGR